ncbi:MAG: hypothetical protein ACYSYV_10370 [Planctomycetota bacterium]|jgi:hypothetical protein
MANRTRSIQWLETRIISEMAKRKVITSYLALTGLLLDGTPFGGTDSIKVVE